ncbi:putative toxin-antitoxin system toxin component, PIN family [Rhizobium rosettiformans W3]|uniref:Putative toxin-antitoxin system toxin component, PIN family n=1 Tax=Rhizobium rosettiformans W3 TaxID=538378 RepID=A0A4S8PGZ4_9HYPH|nr:putative toxin-antitoxin system toxin component, PIN family [Rhizobium rosettiformans]THV29858.1 putative toxin-antitoxin system toxin component, PIN family [Rhizobium rosettiformans W3]
MRVVVDTNVFVGACIGNGASASVLRSCISLQATAILGTSLILEYRDVLGRSELFRSSRLNEEERFELLRLFIGRCDLVTVYYRWRPNLRDEGDNHLVELAIAGGAEAIITHNLRDLKAMELKFPALAVLTPLEWLEKQE